MMPARGVGHRDIRQAIESQYASAAPMWPMTFPVEVTSPKGHVYKWSAVAERNGDDVAITLTPVEGLVPAQDMREFDTLHALALERAIEQVQDALGNPPTTFGKAWMK